MIRKLNTTKGFTLVELVISITIFAFMTALLLAKYGTFNQSVLLTNLAYDVALTIRNAQSYGINVKSAPTSSGTNYSNTFTYGYGVHFDRTSGMNAKMIFYQDVDSNKIYSGTSEDISTYTFKRGSIISNLCAGYGSCTATPNTLDVSFKRPDPDAIIAGNTTTDYTYAEITLLATDGSTKKVIVRGTGQIAIQ